MKKVILLLILSFLIPKCFAQVYQSTEVDKVAEVPGGIEILDLFISSNLRIPLTLAIKPDNHEVLISAIVEKDGSPSALKILRGLDSVANVEALRVVSLFKAWKPALLKTIPVRQSITISVIFKTGGGHDYDPDLKALVMYFGKNKSENTNIEKSKYRRIIPVDVFGIVNGDIIYQEKNDNEWKNLSLVKLERQEFWQRGYRSQVADSVKAIRISTSIQEKESIWKQIAVLKENGDLLSIQQYASNKNPVVKHYYLNGALAESRSSQYQIDEITGWHENGQLASIVSMPTMYKKPYIVNIRDVRERDGDRQVIGGNGYICMLQDDYSTFGIDGCGAVKEGLKEGLWKSKRMENVTLEKVNRHALSFEEEYEAGILLKGNSFTNDGEKFEYTEVEAQPEFIGGTPAMYRYIGKNTKYPKDAIKQGIQGRVYTSFVVDVDGSVQDAKVEKGLFPSLDEEAIRVIRGMNGQWTPGTQRGRKVRVKYSLPIIFGL